MSKSEVRAQMLRARRSLTRDAVDALSSRVRKNLLSLLEFSSAKTVAAYVAKKDEVQTSDIIRDCLAGGKRVIVPRADPSSLSLRFHELGSLADLEPGTFGILEPPEQSKAVPIREADVILVPLVAWDMMGNRVGYGKGYFDRELKFRGEAPCVGLAFEAQRHDPLPTAPTDVPLDIVVTEARVLRFRRGRHV